MDYRPEVRFTTSDDDDASMIAVVLEAMGYYVIRDVDDSADDQEDESENDAKSRFMQAAKLIAGEFELTTPEREVLWRWVGCGEEVAHIADQMCATVQMVDHWQFFILNKLGFEPNLYEDPHVKAPCIRDLIESRASPL